MAYSINDTSYYSVKSYCARGLASICRFVSSLTTRTTACAASFFSQYIPFANVVERGYQSLVARGQRVVKWFKPDPLLIGCSASSKYKPRIILTGETREPLHNFFVSQALNKYTQQTSIMGGSR